MGDFELGRTLLLFFWSFGLAGIEIEIEGGVGWAERLPTWYFKRGRIGRIYGLVMGHRPLTGYHVYAFTIPLLILHLPYVMGVHWTLANELRTDRHLLRARGRVGLPVVRAEPGLHRRAGSAAARCGGSRSRGSGGSRSTTT